MHCLSVHDQRNLFLSNKQLYSSWHVSANPSLANDMNWHLFGCLLDFSQESAGSGSHDTDSRYVRAKLTSDASECKAEAQVCHEQQRLPTALKLCLDSGFQSSPSEQLVCGHYLCKDEIFHQTLAGPCEMLSQTRMRLCSAPNAAWHKLETTAEHAFNVLENKGTNGYLVLHCDKTSSSSRSLLIGQLHKKWTFGSWPCIVSTPKLVFRTCQKK